MARFGRRSRHVGRKQPAEDLARWTVRIVSQQIQDLILGDLFKSTHFLGMADKICTPPVMRLYLAT